MLRLPGRIAFACLLLLNAGAISCNQASQAGEERAQAVAAKAAQPKAGAMSVEAPAVPMTAEEKAAAEARTADYVPGPQATIPDGITYDAGFLEPQSAITHEFVITNTGSEPLLIKDVRSHCGCTVPQFSRDPIAPGEKGTITLRVTQKGNRYDGTASVYTNDPDMQNFKLQVLGTPYSEVRVSPDSYEHLVLMSAEEAELRSPTQVILLQAYRDSDTPDIRINSHQVIGKAQLNLDMSGEVVAATLDNGQPVWNYPIVVDIKEDEHQEIDNLSGNILLAGGRTEKGTQFNSYIRYTYKVRNHVDVQPIQLYFGSIPETTPVRTIDRAVELTAIDDEPFQIVSAKTSDPSMVTRIEDMEGPRPGYRVYVGVPTDHAPGRLDGKLWIQTSHGEQSVVEIPIGGLVRR